MARAIMMSEELISRLVDVARQDAVLWEQLRDRELNQFEPSGAAKIPSLAMLVRELVDRELCDRNHNYDIGSLIVRLRYHTRVELGLPV
jgi:hypothetical protein